MNVKKVETNEKSVDWSIFLGKMIGKNVWTLIQTEKVHFNTHWVKFTHSAQS